MPELALPPPAAAPLLGGGAALGVWRLRQALHRSSAGQWYSAQHALAGGRAGAVLVSQRSERAADVMLRFADQADELGQLDHPGIKVPTDSGVTPTGQPYLVLDWAAGQPIIAACAALSLRERLQWVVQLCEILRYAHQQGWLLGEVDPAALWLDLEQGPEQGLTLMGLGLIRMPDPADPFERGTSPGALPSAMAPERLAGEPPSLVSEVYGLGALLYLLVDGRLPDELGDEIADTSPAAAWPSLSVGQRQQLDDLLHRAAAPLAALRQPSAEALADELRAWLAEASPIAEPAVIDAMPSPTASGSTAPRRGWRLALIGIALATLAAAGLVSRQAMQAGPGAALAQPFKR